ncbi:MAG: T9SS type A sorting domain-containing protein [Bacteroidetes bacterium]|nr:MAG: T9SS type A sorting domain-containing protein [Bacteroidota bacterium]
MSKLFSFLVFLASFHWGWSQIPTGQWRLHSAPKAIDVAVGNGLVFAALENGLVEYDPESKEVTSWTQVNALSDIQVSCIWFDEGSSSFFVGYVNGNIDRIKDNRVYNIPAIKLANVQGSKRVNSFYSHGSLVYAATDLGIVVIDPSQDEVRDTYYPSKNLDPITQVLIHEDTIYALTSHELLRSLRTNPVLADVNQWKSDNRLSYQTDNSYEGLLLWNSKLYTALKTPEYGGDQIIRFDDASLQSMISLPFEVEIKSFRVTQNKLYLALSDGLLVFDQAFDFTEVYNNLPFEFSTAVRAGTYLDGNTYIADHNNGLVRFGLDGYHQLKVPGPPKNQYFSLNGAKNKITVAGGVINKASFTYSRAGAYIFEDENWQLFDANQGSWSDDRVWDISAAAINPNNTNQIAIGGYCIDPLFLIEDGKSIASSFDENNSSLERTTLGNGFICISDMEYDSRGNLWIVNCYADEPLKVRTKDGKWYSFPTGINSKAKFAGRMAIDQNGNKWFAIQDQGIFGYNDGGTIDDPSDDQWVQIDEGENTGALPTTSVTALAVDQDNEIWIGTSNGFAILYNSSSAFDAALGEYNTQRIKIEYEGNVEYLLGNTSITDIEIDGGNRKWIGTANAGIFLLSADGLEIIQSFTKENSPLISNNIVDMHFQEQSGELFIITDEGLVSYRSDASTGDNSYSDVKVFPNPVKENFNGLITIQGIKGDSDVKFTDISGNLVYQTTSNGGTAVWNGKNLLGEAVQAGVYLIWTASNQEKGRKVGKVVILN